jgi:hypothetical protein
MFIDERMRMQLFRQDKLLFETFKSRSATGKLLSGRVHE